MPKRWPGNRAKDPTGKIWFFASSNLIQSTCGDKGRGLTLTQDFISSKFWIGAYVYDFFSNTYRQRLCWYILNYVDIFRTVLIYYWLCWYVFCWYSFDKTLKLGKRICFLAATKISYRSFSSIYDTRRVESTSGGQTFQIIQELRQDTQHPT